MPRDWDTGLCSFSENCSKCKCRSVEAGSYPDLKPRATGCLGLWCPCVVYSQNKTRCEHMRREGVPLYAEERKWCTGDCISYALLSLCCFAWPLQVSITFNRTNGTAHLFTRPRTERKFVTF